MTVKIVLSVCQIRIGIDMDIRLDSPVQKFLDKHFFFIYKLLVFMCSIKIDIKSYYQLINQKMMRTLLYYNSARCQRVLLFV